MSRGCPFSKDNPLSLTGVFELGVFSTHLHGHCRSDAVVHVLEGLMGLVAGSGHLRKRTDPKDAELRKACVCYNHLAGDMGTQLFDSLTAQEHLALVGEDLRLTGSGEKFAADIPDQSRRPAKQPA